MLWPIICLLLFLRLPPERALLWSVIGGYLLLPSATKFDLNGLPDLDKTSMIAIGAGLGTLMAGRRQRRIGGNWLFYGLGLVFVLSPFVTAYNNADPLVSPMLYFPGMTTYDGISLAGANLFVLVPFWAGRRLLSTEQGHRAVLQVLALAMLAYTLPILLEIRLSPQLHRWIYGFFPHDFSQQVRDGGFRAVVFLSHGLLVALMLALAIVAAVVQRRSTYRPLQVAFGAWAFYLFVVLLLQKSLGATVLAVIFAGVALIPRPRVQVVIASAVAIIVCLYPMVRSSQLLPLQTIQSMAAAVSSDREDSLNTRLVNEEQLLKKTSERPIFGWGTWGRNRVYDLEAGKDVSITDGAWIIVMSSFGWIGYLATFGLLSIPIMRLRRLGGKAWRPTVETAGVALVLVLNLCDLIPNSSLSPVTWLLAGALAGYVPRRVSASDLAADGEVAAQAGAEERELAGAEVA